MKRAKWIVLLTTIMLPAASALASEEEAAKAACERVEALRIQEQGAKAPPSVCQYNVRSTAFWQCIEDKIKAGNSWLYSSTQCDDIK